MSNSNDGVTIDSLCTFNYKKKFSFAKKITDENNSDKDDSSSTDTDIEELREKNLNWKGSAKLKNASSQQNDSSDDEVATKMKKK